MAETLTLPAGEVLMEEGSPGDALYVILDGTFEITKRSRDRDLWLASRGPGEMLGEISLLEDTPRTATVRAATDCQLLKISQEDFQHLLTGSSTAAVAMLRTVTARLRNTELMLRQSEKMASLGTLSAGLAHELNNPAAAIPSSATQLRESLAALQRYAAELGTLDPSPAAMAVINALCTVYSLLDEVGEGAERISGIVKAVKSYSYLDQAPVQLVDVHEGLDNTLVILRHKLKGGVTVLKEYAPDLPRIEAYASELNQVWTNLIDNAIDAMDGRGEIRIRTYRQDRSGEGGSRQYIVVEISDSGPGIPPAVQGRIFEAFFTTKEPGKGTGLGLHISYNIVASQHRGEIKVASQPGQTTFQVTLPVALGR